MNIYSMSVQITSLQNCLTVPAIIGPRQTTGSVSLFKRRLVEMISIPLVVCIGSRPISVALAFPCSPKALGIDGPVISASKTAVFLPAFCMAAAKSEVTIDFPTPPLPLTIPITFFYSTHFMEWSGKIYCSISMVATFAGCFVTASIRALTVLFGHGIRLR